MHAEGQGFEPPQVHQSVDSRRHFGSHQHWVVPRADAPLIRLGREAHSLCTESEC